MHWFLFDNRRYPEVELKTEWTPRWNMQVKKPEILINEVKTIVQAFSAVAFQIYLTRSLVAPWLVRITHLHRRYDMHLRLPRSSMTLAITSSLRIFVFRMNSISKLASLAIRSVFARIFSRKGSANFG